jgi:hypothetical protein
VLALLDSFDHSRDERSEGRIPVHLRQRMYSVSRALEERESLSLELAIIDGENIRSFEDKFRAVKLAALEGFTVKNDPLHAELFSFNFLEFPGAS